ncbi:MAG: serine/threonine protein kinase, partial [Polyangiales bacterium]
MRARPALKRDEAAAAASAAPDPHASATPGATSSTPEWPAATPPKAGQALPPDPLLGAVVGGRYRIEAHLRQGGMGSVYVATQLSLSRACALKVIRRECAHHPNLLQRMQREA